MSPAAPTPQKRDRGDMTQGRILPTLALFALPMLMTNFFQQFYVTVDSMILGHWAGNVALGAVSSCAYLIATITCFFFGVSVGAGVILAQLFGARENERFGRAVWGTGYLAIVAGVLMMAVSVGLSRPALAAMNLTGEALDDAVLYMRVYSLSMLPMVVYNMGSAVFRARGDSRTPMVILAVASLFNLAVAFLFVAGFRWGVVGAASATALAQTLSATLTVVCVWRERAAYHIAGTRPTFDWPVCRRMLSVGIPNGIQSTVICVSSVIISSQVNLYGIEATDGFGAYSKIDGWLYMPVGAIQGAITMFVGQNTGAHRFDRAKKGVAAGMFLNVGVTFVLVAVIWTLRWQLLGLFSPDPQVAALGVEAMAVVVPLYFVYSVYMSLNGLFYGVGSAMVPMLLAVAFMCALRVVWVLGTQALAPSLPAIYASYPIAWVCMVVSELAYYRFGSWKHREQVRAARLRG